MIFHSSYCYGFVLGLRFGFSLLKVYGFDLGFQFKVSIKVSILTASSVSLSADVRNMRPQMRTASMPHGTTPASGQPKIPPGMVSSSTLSAALPPPPPPTYERRTEEALLRDLSRINQPHLHSDKIDGALWQVISFT